MAGELTDGRWQGAQPLPVNSAANDFDLVFSAEGRWLYFVSSRDGGRGGDDLYRVPVLPDGARGRVCRQRQSFLLVIPANAGIQRLWL